MKNLLKYAGVAAIWFSALLVSGCKNGPFESTGYDQCMRAKLFKECMAMLPAGPRETRYNDWDEVVSECGSQALYQSLRLTKHIKSECQGN
jgi:hypothetical protein